MSKLTLGDRDPLDNVRVVFCAFPDFVPRIAKWRGRYSKVVPVTTHPDLGGSAHDLINIFVEEMNHAREPDNIQETVFMVDMFSTTLGLAVFDYCQRHPTIDVRFSGIGEYGGPSTSETLVEDYLTFDHYSKHLTEVFKAGPTAGEKWVSQGRIAHAPEFVYDAPKGEIEPVDFETLMNSNNDLV